MFGLHEPRDLPEVFAKYTNVEIPFEIVIKDHPAKGLIDKMSEDAAARIREQHPDLTIETKEPDEDGYAKLKEIYTVAKDNNIQLSIGWPGTMSTMDAQPGRLNVHIKEESDGKWRVQRTCDYG